jgi:hypothetical protein
MAKLKTLLAQKLPEWPEGVLYIDQTCTGALFGAYDRVGIHYKKIEVSLGLAHDWTDALVTRAQWQAERDRIAANQQATKEAREIASGKGLIFGSVDEMCAELEALATGQKKLPYAFTEADIKTAFEAGANWMRGAGEAGADEYVDKLKGLK